MYILYSKTRHVKKPDLNCICMFEMQLACVEVLIVKYFLSFRTLFVGYTYTVCSSS